ncbi:hypothetical protein HDU76_010709, partial [Blyttiomyces sp. JEL0837]
DLIARATKRGVYLPNYNPLTTNPLDQRSQEEKTKIAVTGCVNRVAKLYSQTINEVKLEALVEPFDGAIVSMIKAAAEEIRNRRREAWTKLFPQRKSPETAEWSQAEAATSEEAAMQEFGYCNVRGISGSKDEVLDFMRRHNLDIMMMTETKLRDGASTLFGRVVADVRETATQAQIGTATGALGRGGVLVVSDAADLQIREIEQDPDKRWSLIQIGDSFFFVAYMSPSVDLSAFVKLQTRRRKLESDFPNAKIYAIGDWNVRLLETGDSHTSRTRAFQAIIVDEWLENDGWDLVLPVAGKWTCFSDRGDGRGIPDYLLTNGHAVDSVQDLTVHESEHICNSDHRPMTFCVTFGTEVTKPAFTRININKVKDPERVAKYLDELKSRTQAVTAILDITQQEIDDELAFDNEASYELRQEMVDTCSDAVVALIMESAKESFGIFEFRRQIRSDDFQSQYHQELNRKVKDSAAAAEAAPPNLKEILWEEHRGWKR